MPFNRCLDNGLSGITYFNRRLYTESRSAQLVRDSLQQYKGRPFLVFQLWSVTLCHLRWRHGFNWLQHVQSQNLCVLSPKLGDKSANQILGGLRIVDSHQDFHDSSS